MINLFLGAVRWVVRNLLSLILILGVLLCGKWLHTKWEEAVVARVQLKQLQFERDAIGGELLRVSQALEQKLRLGVSTDSSVTQMQSYLAGSIKAKQVERDQLRKNHPVAVNNPTKPEFKQVALIEMELSILEQAKAQSQLLSNLASDVAEGRHQIATLKHKKYEAEKEVYENQLEAWQLAQQHSVAIHNPLSWVSKRRNVLEAQLPGLQKVVSDLQVRIDSLALTVGFSERKLSDARVTFLIGHDAVDKTLAVIDSRIEQLKASDFWPDLRGQLAVAGWILGSIIFVPIGIKLLFYYVLAPWVSRQPALCLLPAAAVSIDGSYSPGVSLEASGLSLPIKLEEDEELLVHPDYVQSSSRDSQKDTKWVLNWNCVLASLAAGMYALTRILPYKSEPTIVSSTTAASEEIAVIAIREGAALVLHPHYLVGVVQRRDQPMQIVGRWKFGHFHNWLTLQFRHLIFHGPAKLIVRGCRGVRVESADEGRTINQAATLGFSANLNCSVTRCETFLPYWRGQQVLFNNHFAGKSGVYIYEETPSVARKSAVSRGLEGLTDTVLKVCGV